MSRAKLFIENFFAYGFITVLNKIIPFLLLPVITRMLSDPSDYGVYDMYNTIVGFGSPLAMLGMYDAMFREYFEKDNKQYRYDVTSTANRIVVISSVIIISILLVFNKPFSGLLYGNDKYGTIVIFAAIQIIISTNSTIVAAPTRIQNHKKVYIASGLLSSTSQYLLILLLIYFGYSYLGMIYANIISSILLLCFFWILNKNFFLHGKFNKNIAKELFKIGIPLLPTFLIYWVYNSMDKVMITNMLGISELGIYSIGSKFASVSLFIYTAFAGGWSYFSFSTMKDKDQVSLNSKVFDYLGLVSYLSLYVTYPFTRPIFSVLFPKSYISGADVIPYLYMSPLFLMLFQIAANQFLIIKKSYWSTITLSIGAILNVILNYILIKPFGIEGAAIATLVGYMVSVSIVCMLTSHMNLMKITKRFLLVSYIFILYLFICKILIKNNVLYLIMLSIICIVSSLLLYRREIKMLYNKLLSVIAKRNNNRKE